MCMGDKDKTCSLLGKKKTTELCIKLGKEYLHADSNPLEFPKQPESGPFTAAAAVVWLGWGNVSMCPSRSPQLSLFLALPRPRRSGAGATAALPGAGMGTGSSIGFRALLCLGPFSDMLPCEDREEVDSVHEVYREGIFESERLDFLLEKKGESCRVLSQLARDPWPRSELRGPLSVLGGCLATVSMRKQEDPKLYVLPPSLSTRFCSVSEIADLKRGVT